MSGGRWAKAQAKKEKRPRELRFVKELTDKEKVVRDFNYCKRMVQKFMANTNVDPAKVSAIQILLDRIKALGGPDY